jgi:hypothetical protein
MVRGNLDLGTWQELHNRRVRSIAAFFSQQVVISFGPAPLKQTDYITSSAAIKSLDHGSMPWTVKLGERNWVWTPRLKSHGPESGIRPEYKNPTKARSLRQAENAGVCFVCVCTFIREYRASAGALMRLLSLKHQLVPFISSLRIDVSKSVGN